MSASDLESRLASIVDSACSKARIPGLSVAISADGEQVSVSRGTAAAGSGISMTTAARFQIGCITKMLTCVVAMQLVHEGRIAFDAEIEEYLPELTPASGRRGIQVRHLGTHTSGYRGLNPSRPEYGYFYSWPKFTNFFPKSEQVFHPGTVFNYEHTESVILGEVITRVSGIACETLIRDLILDPLQLTVGSIERDGTNPQVRVADHTFDRKNGEYAPVRSVPYCNFWAPSLSSMTISAVDLVTLGELLSGQRRVPGISTETVRATLRQAVDLPHSAGGPEREISPRSFGFGCAQYSRGVFGHNGSARGQTVGLRFAPDSAVAAVVALNCWDPHTRDQLLDSIFRMLLSDAVVDSDAAAIQPRLAMDELPGTYVGCVQGLEIVVTRKADSLIGTLGGLAGVGSPKLQIEMMFDESGQLRASSPVRHLAVGFFREEGTGAPAMLVGLNAFKKVS